VLVEVDLEHRLGAEDPGEVCDVGQAKLAAGEKRLAREPGVELRELVTEPVTRILVAAA
jgi:hypothetical protein